MTAIPRDYKTAEETLEELLREQARHRAEQEEAGEHEIAPDFGPVFDTVVFPLGTHDVQQLTPSAGYPDGNPKTAAGARKPDLTAIPPSALLHLATAMMNGETKYGLYNWRKFPISSRPYVAAALRHLLAYLDGEEFSADTVASGKPVHHLAHVMATCAIVLDAMSIGVLNDNRGLPGAAGDMIERYNADGSFN